MVYFVVDNRILVREKTCYANNNKRKFISVGSRKLNLEYDISAQMSLDIKNREFILSSLKRKVYYMYPRHCHNIH